MKKQALVVLAEGFEEIEAMTPVDVLRRAGVNVCVAGIGGTSIKGAHDIVVTADMDIDSYGSVPDAIVLPGGMPGAENIARDPKVRELIRSMNSEGRILAAICASPALVLAPMGILDGRTATCFPGMERNFPSGVKAVKEKVVRDGNVITAMGPAAALSFSLEVAKSLLGRETADSVGRATLFYE